MKLEREPVFGQLSYKPEFKPFDHDEINQNSRGLDSENWIGKGSQDRILFDSKDNVEEAGQLDVLDLTATNFDLKTCDKGEIEGFVPEKLEFLEQQSDSYMDRRVMEYDLPELVVCYKESSCNTIKDICVDEGVPSQEKIWFEANMDEKTFNDYLSPDEVQKEQLLQHQTGIVTPIPEDLKSSAEKYNVKEDYVIPSDAKELVQSGEAMHDSSAIIDLFSPGKDLSSDDCTLNLNSKSSGNSSAEAEKDIVQISKDKNDEAAETHSSPLDQAEWESLLELDPVSSAIELNCQVDELSSSGEVEYRSIAVGVDRSAPVSISRFANLDHERSSYLMNEDSNNVRADEGGSITCGLNYSDIIEDLCPGNGSSRHLETHNLAEVDTDDMHESRISSEVQPGLATEITISDDTPENGALQRPETSNTCMVDEDISDTEIVSSQVQHSSVPSTISEYECSKDGDYNAQHEPGESSCSAGVPFATLINYKGSFEVQHDQGESSMSAVGNSPSLITSSGPIPYSDSDRFLVQRDIGDSSFAAVDHVTSLINSSGPIPYSGSISLRSDGSTTSNRSFAFPVMYHHDPYGSPVRMAKADRRLLRKHGGWKRGIFCCSF